MGPFLREREREREREGFLCFSLRVSFHFHMVGIKIQRAKVAQKDLRDYVD